MDDRSLVKRLLEIGVAARQRDPTAYARPADDTELNTVGTARIANWLERLGGHRLIDDVQPCFTTSGGGFQFKITEEAFHLSSDTTRFEAILNSIVPTAPKYDVFISYAAGDTHIADELRTDPESNGLRCFMAKKDSVVAAEFQDSIRAALIGSKRILVLLTPRSINRPWVLLETGAAWALGKPMIPALVQVSLNDLVDPIRRLQARVIETTAQRQSLVDEITGK